MILVSGKNGSVLCESHFERSYIVLLSYSIFPKLPVYIITQK